MMVHYSKKPFYSVCHCGRHLLKHSLSVCVYISECLSVHMCVSACARVCVLLCVVRHLLLRTACPPHTGHNADKTPLFCFVLFFSQTHTFRPLLFGFQQKRAASRPQRHRQKWCEKKKLPLPPQETFALQKPRDESTGFHRGQRRSRLYGCCKQ